jgi:hypothetical protein
MGCPLGYMLSLYNVAEKVKKNDSPGKKSGGIATIPVKTFYRRPHHERNY